MHQVKLNDGHLMPTPGFGLFRVPDSDAAAVLTSAVEVGYRHFDTATVYENEAGTGQGIRQCGLARESLFITTKVWNDMQGPGQPQQSLDDSLARLGLDYVDLLLIHWPLDGRQQPTWEDMMALQNAQKALSIGVSNYRVEDFELIKQLGVALPAVNQIPCNPYFAQNELVAYCQENGIAVQAWGPLGMAKSDLLENPVLLAIAQKHGKTTAQIVLRWFIERDITPLPKSATPQHQRDNLAIFDFALDADDMQRIASMDCGRRMGTDPTGVANGSIPL